MTQPSYFTLLPTTLRELIAETHLYSVTRRMKPYPLPKKPTFFDKVIGVITIGREEDVRRERATQFELAKNGWSSDGEDAKYRYIRDGA